MRTGAGAAFAFDGCAHGCTDPAELLDGTAVDETAFCMTVGTEVEETAFGAIVGTDAEVEGTARSW